MTRLIRKKPIYTVIEKPSEYDLGNKTGLRSLGLMFLFKEGLRFVAYEYHTYAGSVTKQYPERLDS